MLKHTLSISEERTSWTLMTPWNGTTKACSPTWTISVVHMRRLILVTRDRTTSPTAGTCGATSPARTTLMDLSCRGSATCMGRDARPRGTLSHGTSDRTPWLVLFAPGHRDSSILDHRLRTCLLRSHTRSAYFHKRLASSDDVGSVAA